MNRVYGKGGIIKGTGKISQRCQLDWVRYFPHACCTGRKLDTAKNVLLLPPKNFKYSVILHSNIIELEIKARNKVSDRAFINEV